MDLALYFSIYLLIKIDVGHQSLPYPLLGFITHSYGRSPIVINPLDQSSHPMFNIVSMMRTSLKPLALACGEWSHTHWLGPTIVQPGLLSPLEPPKPLCSRHPGTPGIPSLLHFCTEGLMYWFLRRQSDSRWEGIMKNIFPSTLSSEMVLNLNKLQFCYLHLFFFLT